MKIARDVAAALAALDPPVLAIVEAQLRRKHGGEKGIWCCIPVQIGGSPHINLTFRGNRITGGRGYDLIDIDMDLFFEELHAQHADWKLKSHQRAWVDKWTVTDPLAWAALKPYTPDERRAILYAAVPTSDFAFGIGDVKIGKLSQNWAQQQKEGKKFSVVARRLTPGYDWRENVITVKGLSETVIRGIAETSPPLSSVIDMGEEFEAEALRYAASRHEKSPCLKIYVKPIAKTLDEDAP